MYKMLRVPVKSKTFIKFLTYLVFCIFLVVLMAGLATYYFFNETLKKEAYRFNDEILLQTMKIVEVVLKEIESEAFSIGLNDDIKKIVSIKKVENLDPMDKRRVVELFEDRIIASNSIHSIYIYLGNTGVMISNHGTTLYKDFIDRFIFEQFMNEEKSASWYERVQLKFGVDGEDNVLTYMISIPIGRKDNTGILAVNIKESVIHNAFVDINRSKLGDIFILNNKGEAVSYGGGPDTSGVLENTDVMKRIQDSNQEHLFFTIMRNKLLITTKTSQFNGWKYVAVNREEDVYKSSDIVLKATILISFFCLGTGVLLSLMVSGRLYRPLKSLVSMIANTLPYGQQNKSLMRLDDFSYLQSSFENVIKENKDMQCKSQENEVILKEHFLLNLMIGHIEDEDKIHKQLEYYGIPLSGNRFVVLVVRLNYSKNSEELQGNNPILLKMKSVCEVVLEQYSSVVVLRQDKFHYLTLCSFQFTSDSQEIEDYIKTMADELKQSILKETNLHVSIGIGSVYSHLNFTSTSYREAVEALGFDNISGHGSIIFIQNVRSGFKFGRKMHQVEEQCVKLEKELSLGNTKNAHQIAYEILNSIEESDAMSYAVKNYFLIKIVNIIMRLVMERGIDSGRVFGEGFNPYYEIKKMNSFFEIREWFFECVRKFSYEIQIQKQNKNSKLVENIKIYIKDHYNEPIDLQQISEMVFLNPKYVSHLFKECTGINFTVYLTDIRLEKAKILLRETDRNIIKIAEKTGFGGKLNFIRAFKRICGMTPSDYRHKVTEELLDIK